MSSYPKVRIYKGVRYLSSPTVIPDGWSECLNCHRVWDNSKSTAITPTPGGRCPFEHLHSAESPRPETEYKGKKWEYLTGHDLTKGNEGWELVAVTYSDTTRTTTYYFKREKSK